MLPPPAVRRLPADASIIEPAALAAGLVAVRHDGRQPAGDDDWARVLAASGR
jgi:hypothetical protein